jgi:bifunctional DNA-binding transcriptional regulator/antitoxin component of YhaV-PrlF toxin-antitoxin module
MGRGSCRTLSIYLMRVIDGKVIKVVKLLKEMSMPPIPITGKIYGTASLNDKGQLVIPVDARMAMSLEPGSKLVVMGAPFGRDALIIVKTDIIEQQMQAFTSALSKPSEDNPGENTNV